MGRSLSGNITLPIRYEWIERCTPFLRQKHKIYTMRRKSVFFDVTSVAMLVTLCAGTLDATPSRQQNSTPQQALVRGKKLFKQTRQEECMLATSGSSVAQTAANGGSL